jgi:hypothetical protein
VPGSTPVLSFGNASHAAVATLGLNPSRQEFLDRNGRELGDTARRFETLASLGAPTLDSAPEAMVHRVVNACNGYFEGNPYRGWFDQLEAVLQSVRASYYDGTACHLDLVQWATDPVWSKLPSAVRNRLLAERSRLRPPSTQDRSVQPPPHQWQRRPSAVQAPDRHVVAAGRKCEGHIGRVADGSGAASPRHTGGRLVCKHPIVFRHMQWPSRSHCKSSWRTESC